MDADEEFSTIANPQGKDIGRLERGQLQHIASEILLHKYGLDINVFKPKYSAGGYDSYGYRHDRDGTSQRLLKYPSSINKRLEFQTYHTFDTETGESIHFECYAVGRKHPFREKLGKLLPRPIVRVEF